MGVTWAAASALCARIPPFLDHSLSSPLSGALRMRWVMECNILRAACLPFHTKYIAGKKMRENACMS